MNWNDGSEDYNKIARLEREREAAMTTLRKVLGDQNENVKRNDLSACVNDLAHRLTMQLPKGSL